MRVPTLTGTNFEEFDISFKAAVSIQNALIRIPLDCLLSTDTVGNYNAACNYHEEKLKICASLQGQAFNDDAATLYNLLVQYVGKFVTSSNNVSCHTRSKNRCNFYLELKVHIKTGAYEEKKDSKTNAIIQSANYDRNKNFTIEHYYNLVAKVFV